MSRLDTVPIGGDMPRDWLDVLRDNVIYSYARTRKGFDYDPGTTTEDGPGGMVVLHDGPIENLEYWIMEDIATTTWAERGPDLTPTDTCLPEELQRNALEKDGAPIICADGFSYENFHLDFVGEEYMEEGYNLGKQLREAREKELGLGHRVAIHFGGLPDTEVIKLSATDGTIRNFYGSEEPRSYPIGEPVPVPDLRGPPVPAESFEGLPDAYEEIVGPQIRDVEEVLEQGEAEAVVGD